MGIKVKCYTDPQKPLQEQLGLPHFFIHLTSFLEGGKGQVTVWLPSSCSGGWPPFCSPNRMSPLWLHFSPDPTLVDWPESPLHCGSSLKIMPDGYLARFSWQLPDTPSLEVP